MAVCPRTAAWLRWWTRRPLCCSSRTARPACAQPDEPAAV